MIIEKEKNTFKRTLYNFPSYIFYYLRSILKLFLELEGIHIYNLCIGLILLSSPMLLPYLNGSINVTLQGSNLGDVPIDKIRDSEASILAIQAVGILLVLLSLRKTFHRLQDRLIELNHNLYEESCDNDDVCKKIFLLTLRNPILWKETSKVLGNFLRHISPATHINEMSIEVRKIGHKTRSISSTIEYGKDIHTFAQKNLQMEILKAPSQVQSIINFLDKKPRCVYLDLSEINFNGIIFSGYDFSGVSFVASTLRKAMFENVTVNGTIFDGADMTDAFFTGAKAKNASFKCILGHRIHFDQAILTSANFFAANLYDISIQKSEASEAEFMSAEMWRAQGGLANFKNANFFGTKLHGADFHASKNINREQFEQASRDKNTRFPFK